MDDTPVPSSTCDPTESHELTSESKLTQVSTTEAGTPPKETSGHPEAEVAVKPKKKRVCTDKQLKALAKAREARVKRRLQPQDVVPLTDPKPSKEETNAREPEPREREVVYKPVVPDFSRYIAKNEYDTLRSSYDQLHSHYSSMYQNEMERRERKRQKRERKEQERLMHGIPQRHQASRESNKITF